MRHHPEAAGAIAERALSPSLVQRMLCDESTGFFAVVFDQVGADQVLAVIDQLGPQRDLGLGFFKALLALDPERACALHLRPDLRRPVLLLSAAGRFTPSDEFWHHAWRDPETQPPLPTLRPLPPGPWLDALLGQSRGWAPPTRRQVLTDLASFAEHPTVRRACLTELLARGDP